MSVMEWTITLRTNFTDRDKDGAAKHNVLKAARHLQVLMKLLQDDIEPEICITGNDWYGSAKEISLHEDIFAQIEQDQPEEEREGISSELMQALMESKGEKI